MIDLDIDAKYLILNVKYLACDKFNFNFNFHLVFSDIFAVNFILFFKVIKCFFIHIGLRTS